jgi:DNA-binding LytR/AlgR family response regulator
LRLGLQVVIEKLHYQHLVRIHRSYAVNRLNIESFTDQTVWVAGQELPIGGAYRDDFIGGFEFS